MVATSNNIANNDKIYLLIISADGEVETGSQTHNNLKIA